MKPTQAQFKAYQQIFDYFNQTLFDNSLPDCMLGFSRRRKSSHQLFTAAGWQQQEQPMAEVSLNLEKLKEGRPKEVMALLVREMVHLWQEHYGQPSRPGYYNREWADKMEEVGLIPTDSGEAGGKRTGQSLKHYVEEGGRFEQAYELMPEEYLLPFEPGSWPRGARSSGYTEKVKYSCEGCGAKVWGKPGLGIVCECGTGFVGEGGEPDPQLVERVYQRLGVRLEEKIRG